MIDCIKIQLISFLLARELAGKTKSTVVCGLKFDPVFNDGVVRSWKSKLRNLQLVIYGDKLTITNSIHKYYHGNNYSDFTAEQLKQSFSDLATRLSLNIMEARVLKVEYGCNVRFDNPMNLIEKIKDYKGKFFKSMYDKSKEYGKKLDLTDFAIKLYDKKMEVKFHDKLNLDFNLLRFEKEVKHIRYLQQKGIPICTVSDLLNPTNLRKLADDLITTFREIHKDPFVDLSKMNLDELKKYSLLVNLDVLKVAQMKSRRSVNSYRKEMSAKIDNEFYDKTETMLSAKMNKLLS